MISGPIRGTMPGRSRPAVTSGRGTTPTGCSPAPTQETPMRIRLFGTLFVIALLATVALFVGETPRGIVQDIRSHRLPWLALALALIIPLAMGAFWAMKTKRNPWNRKAADTVPETPATGTDPAKPDGAGGVGEDH